MKQYRIVFPPSNEEWLIWRNQGIGASDVAALLDQHPFTNKGKIWQRMVLGSLNNNFVSPAMQKGKEMEPAMVKYIAEQFFLGPEDYKEQLCVESLPNTDIRATLDVFSEKLNMLWEMKYINNRERFLQLREPPMYHYLQIQQQLLITGAELAYYVFTNDGYQFRCIPVVPDNTVFPMIQQAIGEFMDNHVRTKQPPACLMQQKDVTNIHEITWRCDRLREIQKLVDEADQLREEIRELTDDPFEYRGIRCGITPRKGGIDYQLFLNHPAIRQTMERENLNIEQFRCPGSMFKRVYMASR